MSAKYWPTEGVYIEDKSERDKITSQIQRELRSNKAVKKYAILDKEVDKSKNTSIIWDTFGTVVNVETQRKMYFVGCRTCKLVYAFKSAKGSGHLNKHIPCTASGASQTNVNQFYGAAGPNAPKGAKEKCLDGCIQYVTSDGSYQLPIYYMDMRPMYSVKQPGFAALVQSCISIGATYGNLNASQVLPSDNTVKRAVIKKVEVVKKILEREINKQYMQGQIICCTTDGWKSEVAQMDYQSLTCHYIDENFVLHNRALGSFPIDGQKSGANIAKTIQEKMKMFGVDLVERSAVFVTDQASNMLKAFDLSKQDLHTAKMKMNPQTRLNCMCHVINRALEVMMKRLEEMDHDFYKAVESVKKVVEFFKRASLMGQLETMLVQEAPTRWFVKTGHAGRNEQTMGHHFGFNTTPTAHLVCVWVAKILKHCEDDNADILQIEEPKKILKGIFSDKFLGKYDPVTKTRQESKTVVMSHKIAVFLNPSSRKMRCFDAIPSWKVKDVKDELKNRMKYTSVTMSGTAQPEAASQPAALASFDHIDDESNEAEAQEPPKKKSLIDEYDDDDEEELPVEQDAMDQEIKLYESISIKGHKDKEERYKGSDGLLKFWDDHKHILPHLACVARDVLAIPSSSTESERMFSAQGNIINKKRNRLNPNTVDALLVLRSNPDITPDRVVITEEEEIQIIEQQFADQGPNDEDEDEIDGGDEDD